MAAIYQWFYGVQVLVTTTMYPIEVEEGVVVSFDLESGWMQPVLTDSYDTAFDFKGGELVSILLLMPEETDSYDTTFGFTGGELRDVLLSDSERTDSYDTTFNFTGGTLEDKLRQTYAPDEGIALAVAMYPANCHMTSV